MRQWTGRSFLIAITLCLLSLATHAQAQQNLLANPGFESDYSGRMGRGDFNFPAGWDGWWTDAPHTQDWMNVPPTGYPHGGPFRRSGVQMPRVSPKVEVHLRRRHCNESQIFRLGQSCEVVHGSISKTMTAQMHRFASALAAMWVQMSMARSHGHPGKNASMDYRQISIEHTATGGEVTLFIYATQTWPNDP